MANLLPSESLANAQVPLAWRNIVHDKSRLVRSALGIAFAVFLMMVQLGFQAAFVDSTVALIRSFDADIVIISSAKYQLAQKASFSRRQLHQAKAVRGVASARPIYAEWLRSSWKNPSDQQSYLIQVLGFDPDEPVFLFPELKRSLEALRHADTIVMDSRSRPFLGTPVDGAETELARRKVRIVGTFALGPNFVTDGTVILSDRNFAKIFGGSGTGISDGRSSRVSDLPGVEFGLIKVAPGTSVADVQRSLRHALPSNVIPLTKREFIDQENKYQAQFSGVGPVFGIGTLVGFAIGIMICYQILFEDVSNRRPQYATLKAMGYSDRDIIAVVLRQAAIYAFVGYVPALVLSASLFAVVGDIALLPMRITPWLLAMSFILTLVMCLLAGIAALRHVLRQHPAEVF